MFQMEDEPKDGGGFNMELALHVNTTEGEKNALWAVVAYYNSTFKFQTIDAVYMSNMINTFI